MKFDDLVRNHLGEFGRYQKCLFILVCLPCILAAMHALSWTFSAANLPYRCRLPYEPSNSTYRFTEKPPEISYDSKSCVKFPNGDDKCNYESCTYNGAYGCPYGYVYDFSEIQNSAINEWDIVCDRHFLKAIIQFMYYVGQLIGAIMFGHLGDRIGRKKVVFMAMAVEIVCGFMMAFSPHWILFSLGRIGVGMAHPAITSTCIVIGMELVGPFGRRYGSLISGAFFSLGYMILAFIGYFVRDFVYLQLILALPALGLLSYWWLLPESPRWLVSQRRYHEADHILQYAAKVNKTSIPHDWWQQIDDKIEDKSVKKYTFLDLFKTTKLRCRTLSAFFLWPVASMVYYGLSMNTNFLGGNLYLTFFLGALVDTPANIFVFYLIDKTGRKPLIAGGFIATTLVMFSNVLMDHLFGSDHSPVFLSVLQYLIAKSAITTTYAGIYLFTPELFPTVLRTTATGACSMMARLGGILASLLSMWLVDEYGKLVIIIPFASLSIMSAFVVLMFLPETLGHELKETIEDIEGKPENSSVSQSLIENNGLLKK